MIVFLSWGRIYNRIRIVASYVGITSDCIPLVDDRHPGGIDIREVGRDTFRRREHSSKAD